MNIAFITDENYVMPTCVAMVSLIENCVTERINIYVLCDEVSNESKEKLSSLENTYVKVDLLDVENALYSKLADELKTESGIHVSRSSLFKFDLPNLLKNIDKTLYLDSDIIVQKDISEIYKIDLDGYYLAAVDDMGDTYDDLGYSSQAKCIGFVTKHYFNSGVMLLNLEKMRGERISDKLRDYRKNNQCNYMDQDAFNYVTKGRVIQLPYNYNFLQQRCFDRSFEDMNRVFFYEKYLTLTQCIEDQHIIHFAGPYKPWEYQMDFFSGIYKGYLGRSPYKDKEMNLKPLIQIIWTEMEKLIQDIKSDQIELKKRGERINILRDKLQLMDWRFPYEEIPTGSKLVIYGAGEVGKSFVRQGEIYGYKIVLWVDKNYQNCGDKVKNPAMIEFTDWDYILIAVSKGETASEIKDSLQSINVDEEKIILLKPHSKN